MISHLDPVNIAVLGDSNTGKTSIIERQINNKYEYYYKNTTGIDRYSRREFQVFIDDNHSLHIPYVIYEMTSREEFRRSKWSNVPPVSAVIIVYDITNQTSYFNVTNYIEEVKEHCNDDTVIILAGSKLDYAEFRETEKVPDYEILPKFWKSSQVIGPFECSAKDNKGIDKIFDTIAYWLPAVKTQIKNSPTLDQELFSAIMKNRVERARFLLENGASPSFNKNICNTPPLFLAKSAEIISLLLEYGADPNESEFNSVSLLCFFAVHQKYDLITALANHYPCKIHNVDINRELINLLSSKLSIDKCVKLNAILSLIRVSRDLQEVPWKFLPADYDIISPFSWSLGRKYQEYILPKLMLDNNYILWEDLKHDLNRTDEINAIFNEAAFTRFFHGLNCWQLLSLGFNDKLPLDIILSIIKILIVQYHFDHDEIESCKKYFKPDRDLHLQMIAFGKLYTIQKQWKSFFSCHGTWDKLKHLSSFRFDTELSLHVANNKTGLGAETIILSKKHYKNISPDNEELVSSLVENCTKDKILFFTSKEEVRHEIKTELAKTFKISNL